MYGNAGTIGVKSIGTAIGKVDILINEWLKENEGVDIVDIKFSTAMDERNWGSEALIIYRK